MPYRQLYALDLVADASLIAAYEARHAPGAVWPEIVRDIRDRGFLDMEIWRVDDRLVMIAELDDDAPHPSTPEALATVAAWEAQMDAYQRPLHADGPKWAAMRRIFALGEQP